MQAGTSTQKMPQHLQLLSRWWLLTLQASQMDKMLAMLIRSELRCLPC